MDKVDSEIDLFEDFVQEQSLKGLWPQNPVERTISGNYACVGTYFAWKSWKGRAEAAHADYTALEEERDKFKALWDQTEACLLNSMEELASLRARVVELVEASHPVAYPGVYEGRPASADCINRLRLALEDLK